MKRGKRYNHQKKKKPVQPKPKLPRPVIFTEASEEPQAEQKVRFLKKWRKEIIIGVVALMIAAIPVGFLLYDRFFKTEHEKYEDENTKQGSVEFPPIDTTKTVQPIYQEKIIEPDKRFFLDSAAHQNPMIKGIFVSGLQEMSAEKLIEFDIGSNNYSFTVSRLRNGVNLIGDIVGGCVGEELLAIAKGDRIYCSCIFLDLFTGNKIGDMEFNHWKIYIGEFLDYKEANDKFEVIDKRGYIPFSIANISSGSNVTIRVRGYFNDLSSIAVINDPDPNNNELSGGLFCIPKSNENWINDAQKKIKQIKTSFPKDKP